MSVFHDVLMEKSAKRKDKERGSHIPGKGRLAAASGAIAIGGSSLLGRELGIRPGHILANIARGDKAPDASAMKRVVDQLDPDIVHHANTAEALEVVKNTPPDIRKDVAQHFGFTWDDARNDVMREHGDHLNPYVIQQMDSPPKVSPHVGQTYLPYDPDLRESAGVKARGLIHSPTGRSDVEGVLHELGHATGRGKGGLTQRGAKLMNYMNYGARGAGLLGGGVAAYQLGRATNKEEVERAQRFSRNSAIASGLMSLPLLAEEARANIRAVGLGRKFGVKLNKGVLAGRMGTYLGAAGLTALTPYLLNKRIARLKLEGMEKRREKK